MQTDRPDTPDPTPGPAESADAPAEAPPGPFPDQPPEHPPEQVVPPSPRRRRIVNGALCVLCAAALAMYVLAANEPADPEAAGGFAFDEDTAAEAQLTGRWIMMALFGALTLIFGWRALRPDKPAHDS